MNGFRQFRQRKRDITQVWRFTLQASWNENRTFQSLDEMVLVISSENKLKSTSNVGGDPRQDRHPFWTWIVGRFCHFVMSSFKKIYIFSNKLKEF